MPSAHYQIVESRWRRVHAKRAPRFIESTRPLPFVAVEVDGEYEKLLSSCGWTRLYVKVEESGRVAVLMPPGLDSAPDPGVASP